MNREEDIQKQTNKIKESVNNLVNKNLASGRAQKISVFYRDLSNRQWFGINENDNFAPGSLLKLPLAMVYYKLSEIDPTILDQEYRYLKKIDSNHLYNIQNIKPKQELQEGNFYKVSELIESMVQDSSNEPVPILASNVSQGFFNKVYIDLGVFFPKTGGIEQDFVSVKTYGAILRTLYNASYLNQKNSNELLKIMSNSSFRSGLVSGVPENVKVANKFGERVVLHPVSKQITSVEIHDCGIIYSEEENYILCVMTKGKDIKVLSQIIAEISKKIYEIR